jgi:hypothetical protein
MIRTKGYLSPQKILKKLKVIGRKFVKTAMFSSSNWDVDMAVRSLEYGKKDFNNRDFGYY